MKKNTSKDKRRWFKFLLMEYKFINKLPNYFRKPIHTSKFVLFFGQFLASLNFSVLKIVYHSN